MTAHYDVAIIGAGAAGLMCAAECAKRGRRTLIIEHMKKPGEKIRISGGGRCNFTNLHTDAEAFISANPHFCKSALSRYTQWDFITMVDAHGIAWHEKKLGQLFCDGRSSQIIDMLLTEASDADLWLECAVDGVHHDGGYQLTTSRGIVRAESLVVACGGKSIPKIGATSFGYEIARQFGVAATETRAGLVPFTLSPDQKDRLKPLTGVAADVKASAGDASFDEALLFTHRGLSGPAALQISSYWREGEELRIAFDAPGECFDGLRAARSENGRRAVQTALSERLPKALAAFLVDEVGVSGNLADHSDAALREIAEQIGDWRLKPVGTEGYRTAEVTLGGVDTDALDSRTMTVKAQPGLYFIGEVVDVTGWLGGYNFQWAWSSGWAAGQDA
ncbi:MAG: NAD(P)/FAD-dependent oxidoreductase [Pseudomonadota bacterium]